MDNDSRNDISNSEYNFGNPVMVPRVGDQYQAQIPPLVIDCCCQETDSENDYSIGLPVPITWAHCNDVKIEKKPKNIGRSPLPILPCRPWKAIESESFVVGLYIFGKNLNNVNKFVESKRMEEILGYYYGEFYMSSRYHRWSKGKKMKIKSCIRGEKIFAGWRRHELLSRLFLHASEESRGLLRKITTKYEEDKASLEKYVFTLRRIVGIETLIDAISIGKGKRDLTRTVDPKKTQNLPSHIPKIPKDKKLSSLTPREIALFLTKIHLSKPRLTNLFWDAVWPRLLSNGWRSEQPKYLAIFNSKRSLVFIVPGVGKFLRRSLVKGDHYFDSVKEVLDKVASDPSLLNVKTDEKKANDEKETELEVIHEQNDDVAKFTIVDTSLPYGRDRSKVIATRTLPVEADYDIYISSRSPSEAEQESSDDIIYESDKHDHSPESTSIQDEDESLDGPKSVVDKSNGDESPCDDPLDRYENTESQVGQSQILSLDDSSGRESVDEYEEDDDCNEQRSRALIDLNFPPRTQEVETNETLVKKPANNYGDSDTSTQIAHSQANEQCSDSLNGRRQSTRNRPLTSKALEAIAYGFLTPNRKRKNEETHNSYISSRSPRMARDKIPKCPNSRSADTDTD